MGALPIDAVQLGLAALLVLSAGLVSIVLRLRLERRLAIAAVRTVVQLLLVGYVLGWVFDLEAPFWVAALALAMVVLASRAAVARSSRRYPGVFAGAFLTLASVGLVTTLVTTRLVLEVDPWWRPQYLIPLLGMLLGNSLTGVSLCLDELLRSLDEHRDRVEMELALGATRWEAAQRPLREAVRRGMIPILNAMTVVGIVSLPGMMTGQILQGADPLLAVRYQIVIMFMVAAATSFGCIGVAFVTALRLFNGRHQLDIGQIASSP